MAADTQKVIGWILLGISAVLFIYGISMPEKSPTSAYDEATYTTFCENGEMIYGDVDYDGWEDCEDGSDEPQTAGAEFGAACCCLAPIGFLCLVINSGQKRRQVTIIQNPAQMQMQMQMQAQQQQMQMQAQQQQMQMQAQQQQMNHQQQMQQMRKNVGGAVQQVGAKISGGDGNREKFKEILSMVLADGNMSKQEEESIEKKRNDLNISMEEHRKILGELGLDYDKLKQLQQAKIHEDSGRLDTAAQLYEDAGKLDKASSIRFQLKAMEKSGGGGGVHTTTYNISDSAIGGGINEGNE